MNIFLQIGLGLLPGTVVTLFLLFKRRAFQLKKIMLAFLLVAGCGALTGFGAFKAVGTTLTAMGSLSQKETLAFANALVEQGAYDAAAEVIEEYSADYGYDDGCRLLNARIALLEEDYESAAGLYNYLCTNTDLVSDSDDEVKFANQKLDDDVSELAMIEYLTEVGADITDYGYTESSAETIRKNAEKTSDDIKKSVKEAIEKQYSISDEAEDCAKAVARVSDAALSDSDEDGSTNKYKKAFQKIEETASEYLALECVSKARIEAYVLSGDFDGLTAGMTDNASYHELMIVAEMYMSGLVKKSDFPESYQGLDSSDAVEVENRLGEIYDKESDDLTAQERKNLKTRVTAVTSQMDEPILSTVKQQLTDAAETEAGTDQTKVYLELAKIENYFGNETSTDSCLNKAIYSSQDCEDDSYAAAMAEIIAVINNDGDTENIKNVSEYVNDVLDHSLTISVERVVSPQYQPSSDDNSGYDGSWDEDDEESGKNSSGKKTTLDFAQTAVDYVSRVKSAITIGKIDASEFEKITARVQISSDYITDTEELKQAIKVYDCNTEITDFTLRKIDYTGSNIILVCDVSGSMIDRIQDLRDAVVTFIKDKNADENISIVTFNDSIVDTISFGADDSSLISFADGMDAGGGTDIFSAVVNSMASFPESDSENNILILMTDGQDDSKSQELINEQIGAPALQKGVTIYAIGLGEDVNASYLQAIADSGNGDLVYVSDSASLTSFYDMLHSQVYSQYEISYTAQDTITLSNRTLEVALPSENLKDRKTYSLNGYEEDENALTATADLSVSGMSPRYLYKGQQDVTASLKGTGFQKDSSITVRLNGSIDYTITAEYADAETYKLTIPSSVAVGDYDVEVTIDGKQKVLQNGFSVIVQGDEQKTAFGPYLFTSAEKIESGDNHYILRGAVTMNGWLHFKGDVELYGDLENDSSIEVTDSSGSYVSYDTATAEGFASYLAGKGVSLDVPALGPFTLYNDSANRYDYSKYQVDDIMPGVMQIYSLVQFDYPTVRLYPDSIGLYYSTGTTQLPYQDQILKAAGSTVDLFDFSCSGSAQLTDKKVGIVLEASYDDTDDDNESFDHHITMLNTPVNFNGQLDVKIDTIKSEYTVGAYIQLDIFEKTSGLGAEISWKEGLVPDSVKLRMKTAKPLIIPTAIPIEVNNFTAEVSNINDALAQGNILSLEFTGTMDFTMGTITDYIPGLGEYFDDVSLLSMPETTLHLTFSPISVNLNASLFFMDEIKLADAELSIGTFEYTNGMLSLDSAEVTGLYAKLKTGFMWENGTGNVSVDVSGTGELDAHSRFIGVDYSGDFTYDIKWWAISCEKTLNGEVTLGLYVTHSGTKEFVFAYRTTDKKGKVKGNFYYIDENGKSSTDKKFLR